MPAARAEALRRPCRPPSTRRLVWGLASALIIGSLVGIERERSKALSGNVGIGGVRTFILFSLIGAVSAWLSQALGNAWIFVTAVAAVAALTIAGYVVQARVKPNAVGLTTETAAVGVCLLGGACTVGYAEVALAVGIAVSAVLAYKEPMHGLVAKLGPDDISAGVKLLAATFIVLPLLPTAAVDPWGALKPRSLWTLVILIAALSLVGYVATRALGPQRGTAVTGLSGGLVSSTAVTLAFAKQSREEGGRTDDALAGGLLLAWAVMSVRIVVLAAILFAPLVRPLLAAVRGDECGHARGRRLLPASRPRRDAGRGRRRPPQEPVQPDRRRQVRPAVRGRAARGGGHRALLPRPGLLPGRRPRRPHRRGRDHPLDDGPRPQRRSEPSPPSPGRSSWRPSRTRS